MPVTLAPAQPLSPEIAAQYGRAQQFNQSAPLLASVARANADRAAASHAQELAAQVQTNIASGENITRATIAGNEQGERRYLLDQENRSRGALLEREIAARRESQQEAMLFDASMFDRKVGYQDQLRMQQQQAGLAQLEQDVRDGLLSKEEAADAAYELKTNIDRTDQKLRGQQMREQAARADMHEAEVKRMKKVEEDLDKMERDLIDQGHTTLRWMDDNGKVHILIKNKRSGEWYNPLMTSGKQTEAMNQEPKTAYSTKEGQFDRSKAITDAEKEAKLEFPVKKDPETGEDVNMADRVGRAKQLLQGYEQEHAGLPKKGAMAGAIDMAMGLDKKTQKQLGKESPPPEAILKSAKVVEQKIAQNPKLDGMQKSQALSSLEMAKRIIAKPDRTPEDQKVLGELLDYLEGVAK